MGQILIVLDDKKLCSLLQNQLAQKYGGQVILKESASDAISMLQMLPDIEIILTRDTIRRDFTAAKICDYLTVNKADFQKEVSVLILGTKATSYTKAISVGENPSTQKLVAQIGYLLGKEAQPVSFEPEPEPILEPTVEKQPESEQEEKTTVFVLPKEGLKSESPKSEPQKSIQQYHPFHVLYLSHIPPETDVHFGIFTRIKKGDGYEYSQKIAAGSRLSKTDIDKLLMRTGKDLYVKKEEAIVASEFLNKFFLEKFRKTDLDLNQKIIHNSEAYEILLETFKHSSFDKYSVELIKELVKSIDSLMKVNDALAHFKNFIAHNKISYGYMHTHFTCLLIFLIIDKFEWSKEQSKNKIIYLALFHDLSLGSDRLIKLHHHYFQEAKNLNEDEKQLLLNHADVVANILETIVKAPKELTSLVREHHGLKSGKGFAEAKTIAISSLSMAFIVAEEIVTQYLDLIDKMDKSKNTELPKEQLQALFTELKKKCDKLAYAEAASAYQKLFLEAA